MSVKLYAFTCGTLTGALGNLMAGGEGDITVPVPAYFIEHPRGRVVFDTGLHPDLMHEPEKRLGERLAAMFRVGFGPGEDVASRLAAIDRDPWRVDLLIASHLYFDHVGGNALIPNATLLVQRREWDVGMDREAAPSRGFDRRDYDLGHKTRIVDGEHDVFGDGSVMIISTPGHTPGHQALLVRLPKSGAVVLSGDAVHFKDNWDNRRVPSMNVNKGQTLASMQRIADIVEKEHGQLWINHDKPQSDAQRRRRIITNKRHNERATNERARLSLNRRRRRSNAA